MFKWIARQFGYHKCDCCGCWMESFGGVRSARDGKPIYQCGQCWMAGLKPFIIPLGKGASDGP
jgi:hypothetical protein